MTGDNRNDLGRMLKQRRLMIPLTLQELASVAHVSSSHLGRIERGERFPSARILRRIASPLQMEEAELMSLAGYLSPEPTTASENTGSMQLDPYVSMVLSQEPVEVQRAVVTVLIVLKGMARSLQPNSALPEFRDYAREKYPQMDEDMVTMITDLIERGTGKK